MMMMMIMMMMIMSSCSFRLSLKVEYSLRGVFATVPYVFVTTSILLAQQYNQSCKLAYA